MSIGSFCLVLHSHIPYVRRHGQWPHGEDWLYEAAAESYLPLLAVIDECAFHNASPIFTIGLTPVLLEQLAHEDFRKGLEHYLEDRVDRARQDREEFRRAGERHYEYLAQRWIDFYSKLGEQFAELGRDIPAAFAERARAIADREGLNGRPIGDYVKLAQRCHNNLRAMLQAVEAGDMLEASA